MEKQWEYTIPYGMEATIVDNKIIFKKKESEDERIRKEIINFIKVSKPNWENYRDYSSWITWLEKKGGQKPADEEMIEILRTEYEKGRADAITEMRKPWSEEDTIAINRIIAILVDASEVKCWWEVYRLIEKEEMIKLTDFLNSLINRVQSPPKQEWSEEDEVGLGDALWCCKQAVSIAKDENDMGNVWYAEQWLKSLKERVGCAIHFTTTREWSEEDERMLNDIFDVLSSYYSSTDDVDCDNINKIETWLKGIKERYTWKPSDEQINALDNARHSNPFNVHILDTLFHELKKL